MDSVQCGSFLAHKSLYNINLREAGRTLWYWSDLDMNQQRERVKLRFWLTGTLLAIVASVSVSWDLDLHAPPRFDGAGYAILAKALLSGQGYREIDRPGAPLHAHFPPGYPAALSSIWLITGPSVLTAHVFSTVCVVVATLAAWQWFRSMECPRAAAWMGLTLALNWTWSRTAGAIQSEPLYLALSMITLLISTRIARKGSIREALFLGLMLGACVLTRHVGVMLAASIGFYLLLQRRVPAFLSLTIAGSLVVLPWVAWVAFVHENTQPELLVRGGSLGRIAAQSLFYTRRLPDVLTGPIVEVGTVFTMPAVIIDRLPSWISVATCLTVWAFVATVVITYGCARTLWCPRRRLAGLVAFFTLGLLLVWPFTEAGRFLIPLVPCLLLGAVEGLSPILRRLETALRNYAPYLKKRRQCHPKSLAAILILLVSMPYAIYSLASRRAGAQRQNHADFDAACSWIMGEAKSPGPILTRHPGEVYWLTGRQAVPAGLEEANIGRMIEEHHVAYLLVDNERYANAPVSPLALFCETEGARVREVWSHNTQKSTVRIYEVVRPKPVQRAGPSKMSVP